MTKSIKRMKRLFAWGTALLLVGGMQAALLPVDEPITPVDYVSTLVGTQSKHALSTGNTYPAVAMPWGMNFWTPQTGTMGDGWAYTYDADKIRGFKQTHQPSPWINDYGQFAIMPITGKVAFDQDERASWFSHKAETATPYYYKVYLADHDVTAEFAPTERAAAFRFTFPETEEAYVVVDAMDNGSFVKIIPAEKKIIGYTTKNSGGVPSNFKNYFVLQFDKPFTYTAAVKDGKIAPRTTEVSANHAGGIIGFHTLRGEQVNVRVASSFISHEQAELNLKELGDRTLEEVAKAGRDEWNRVLGRIEVQDTDLDRLRTFYSCFYRSVLFPRSFYEIDAQGQVMHYSPYNGEVAARLYVYRHRFLGHFPLSLPLSQPDVSIHECQDAGRIGQHLQGERFPARMGQSGTPWLHGGQQFRLCGGGCLAERSAWLRHRDIMECCEERYGECASRGFLYRTPGT